MFQWHIAYKETFDEVDELNDQLIAVEERTIYYIPHVKNYILKLN